MLPLPRKYRLALTLASLCFMTQAMAQDITGAGSTFDYPIYAKWAEAYRPVSCNGLN